MTDLVFWCTVVLAEWVDYNYLSAPALLLLSSIYSGRQIMRRTVWASRSAAVGVVSKLVDVHATLGIGIVSGNVVADGRWGGL